TSGTHDREARSSRSKCPRQHETMEELLLPQVHHEFLLWEGCSREAKSKLCHEFNSTYEFDEVCADDELQSKKIIKFRLGGRAHNLTILKFDQRDLDRITLRYLIDSDGKLVPKDSEPGVPRVGIPRPPRVSMHDLYDRMGRMEIRQDVIEQMEYRQSYHRDMYHGVFEHMAGVYSILLQGTYNPLGYAQPQRTPNVVEPELRTIVEVAPMADNRTTEELLQTPTEGYREAIVISEINADHFEIKTNLLQLVQANPYHGFEGEIPHTHINNFKRIMVKEKQEKDKIGTKPDKNGKRGKARQCRRPITVKKAEKEENTSQGTKDANPKSCIEFKTKTRTESAICSKLHYKGQFCQVYKVV
nr:reverse transcriptase domain-containing protein [Tanacetum cinerariifolium]